MQPTTFMESMVRLYRSNFFIKWSIAPEQGGKKKKKSVAKQGAYAGSWAFLL
jgi:hypothetical protein